METIARSDACAGALDCSAHALYIYLSPGGPFLLPDCHTCCWSPCVQSVQVQLQDAAGYFDLELCSMISDCEIMWSNEWQVTVFGSRPVFFFPSRP